MDVIIVVHTEFGYVTNNKVVPDKASTNGVSEGVTNLIKIADKYNAKITFAVMPEVTSHFPKNVEHEIGLHVHAGWEEFRIGDIKFDVGDKYLREHCNQSLTSTVLRDYPYSEQLEMIKTGVDCIEDHFEHKPTTFVAGRWSINNDTVRALLETKIERDCSAPAHSKSFHHDWSNLPRICMPYHPNESDYQEKGTLPLLIIPVSQMAYGGNVNPEVVPQLGLSWLKACFSEYYKQGIPLFHICLHSPCMTDPYFMSAMDNLLHFIVQHKKTNFKFASSIHEYNPVDASTHRLSYLQGLNPNFFRSHMIAALNKLGR
jgi:peptidoglycan/xylan/chitin deacetylase (PgdA/CDA1 family)